MEIKVKGEMTIAEIKQALFEKLLELEDDYAVRYSRGATLYINPTNGFGDEITPCNKHGRLTSCTVRGRIAVQRMSTRFKECIRHGVESDRQVHR
jgi:hypothetical protein